MLADQIRDLQLQLKEVKGRMGISEMSNQTLYQALSNQTIESPTLVTPTADTVTITNPDAGGDATLTASGATTTLTTNVDLR
jgi:hypothetical protein